MLWCVCVRKNKQGLKEKQSAKPFCLYRAVGVYNALFLVLFFGETYDNTTSYQALVEHHLWVWVWLRRLFFEKRNYANSRTITITMMVVMMINTTAITMVIHPTVPLLCYSIAYIDDILLTDHSTIRKIGSDKQFQPTRQYVNRFRQTISAHKTIRN